MTDEPKSNRPVTQQPAPDDMSWATIARTALASTADLTANPPETLARLLAYEARDDGTPLFSLLVTVKAQSKFWADLLDALKREVLAG
jgi:hypothetical protein